MPAGVDRCLKAVADVDSDLMSWVSPAPPAVAGALLTPAEVGDDPQAEMAISPAARTPMERRPRLEAASESVMSKSFSGVSKEDLKRRGTRYVQPEHGAPAIFLDEFERPSMGRGDGSAEGQTQTGPAIFGR